jgi:hypothetical protein
MDFFPTSWLWDGERSPTHVDPYGERRGEKAKEVGKEVKKKTPIYITLSLFLLFLHPTLYPQPIFGEKPCILVREGGGGGEGRVRRWLPVLARWVAPMAPLDQEPEDNCSPSCIQDTLVKAGRIVNCSPDHLTGVIELRNNHSRRMFVAGHSRSNSALASFHVPAVMPSIGCRVQAVTAQLPPWPARTRAPGRGIQTWKQLAPLLCRRTQ